MTKAAWDNLIAGLANPDADVGQLIDNLIVAIVGDKDGEGLLNQIIPAVKNAVEGIGKFIKAAVPALAQELPGLIQSFLPVIIESAMSLVSSVIEALPDIINTLAEMMPQIAETIINGLVDALMKAVPALVKQGPAIVKALAKGIIKTQSAMNSAGKRVIDSLSKAVKSALTALGSRVAGLARKIPEGIKRGLGNLWSVGANLIQGLWGGISARFNAVVSRVKALASKLPAAVKKVLGIASPSKVFMEIGRRIPEGMALGIERNMGMVDNAMDLMSGATEFTPLATEGDFGGQGVQITNYITVDGQESPEDFANRFMRQMQLDARMAYG